MSVAIPVVQHMLYCAMLSWLVVLFTVHILVFIFITVEYSPYGMQLYVLMLLMIVHLLLNVDKDACCHCAMHVYLIYGI